jgi:hypothetical protein
VEEGPEHCLEADKLRGSVPLATIGICADNGDKVPSESIRVSGHMNGVTLSYMYSGNYSRTTHDYNLQNPAMIKETVDNGQIYVEDVRDQLIVRNSHGLEYAHARVYMDETETV